MKTPWTYYQIETQSGQYGKHIKSIEKTTKEKGWNSGCADSAGCRSSVIRARCGVTAKVREAIVDNWGRVGSGYSPKGGIEIEWL